MKKIIFAFILFASLGSVGDAMAWEGMTCAAQALCPIYCAGPYGYYLCGQYPVSCYVTGNSYTGALCTYQFQNGVGVECTGMTAEGIWGTIAIPCQ